jgi:hypothetical protein
MNSGYAALANGAWIFPIIALCVSHSNGVYELVNQSSSPCRCQDVYAWLAQVNDRVEGSWRRTTSRPSKYQQSSSCHTEGSIGGTGNHPRTIPPQSLRTTLGEGGEMNTYLAKATRRRTKEYINGIRRARIRRLGKQNP